MQYAQKHVITNTAIFIEFWRLGKVHAHRCRGFASEKKTVRANKRDYWKCDLHSVRSNSL